MHSPGGLGYAHDASRSPPILPQRHHAVSLRLLWALGSRPFEYRRPAMPPFRLFLRQIHHGRWTGPVRTDSFLLAHVLQKVGAGRNLGPTLRTIHSARAELLHVLMLPDFDRADRISESSAHGSASYRHGVNVALALARLRPARDRCWSGCLADHVHPGSNGSGPHRHLCDEVAPKHLGYTLSFALTNGVACVP